MIEKEFGGADGGLQDASSVGPEIEDQGAGVLLQEFFDSGFQFAVGVGIEGSDSEVPEMRVLGEQVSVSDAGGVDELGYEGVIFELLVSLDGEVDVSLVCGVENPGDFVEWHVFQVVIFGFGDEITGQDSGEPGRAIRDHVENHGVSIGGDQVDSNAGVLATESCGI